MKLKDFIKKYEGRKVEAGGPSAKFQCVDLVNQYIAEVLKLPKILWTNACDFPKKADRKYWDWIVNTPLGVPKEGDIIVWNKNAGGGYGHVAIFIEGDVNSFRSLDQNWPLYSPVHIQGHYYKNVAGWLRKKGGSMGDCLLYNTDKDRKTFEELVSKSSRYDEFKKGGFENIGQVNNLIEQMRDDVEKINELAKIERERADELRKKYNDFIATISNDNHLHCVQEEAEILAEAKKAGTNAKELEDVKRAFGAYKEQAVKTESDLRAEIARLKAMLKQENVLKDAKLEELLREIIRRLINIVSNVKK